MKSPIECIALPFDKQSLGHMMGMRENPKHTKPDRFSTVLEENPGCNEKLYSLSTAISGSLQVGQDIIHGPAGILALVLCKWRLSHSVCAPTLTHSTKMVIFD